MTGRKKMVQVSKRIVIGQMTDGHGPNLKELYNFLDAELKNGAPFSATVTWAAKETYAGRPYMVDVFIAWEEA